MSGGSAATAKGTLRVGLRAALADGVDLLWRHPQVRSEVVQLCDVLADRVDHVHEPLADRPDVPLQIHARYTRLGVLAPFGVGADLAMVTTWQSGVWWPKMPAPISSPSPWTRPAAASHPPPGTGTTPSAES